MLCGIISCYSSRGSEKKIGAVTTLISGKSSAGYVSGALALGQSIKDVGSKLELVALVTEEVPKQGRESLSKLWSVVEVETIICNHKHNLDAMQYDLKGEKYQQGVARWSTTCTKFHAWRQVMYERVIFMDADMLVVGPIDDALWGFSNASFAAAPEAFPPDTFNAGFMVLTPSIATFERLLELNELVGSTEGGDQGVLNNGLCPQWFSVGPSDPDCGRLPWLFNVEVVQYNEYKTLRAMNQKRLPSVIHFVSDGKPWVVLMYEYHHSLQPHVDPSTFRMLGKQAVAHLLWRVAFFKAAGTTPSDNSFLIKAALAAEGQGSDGNNKPRYLERKRKRRRTRGKRKRRSSRSNKLIRKLRERRRKKMGEL